MRTALIFSKFERQISSFIEAKSRIFPFFVRVLIPPLFCGLSKQSNIQNIGFIGIYEGNLFLGQFFRYQIMLNSVCVDMVIDLCQFSFGRPSDLLLFIGFKPLEFFDNIYFELGTDPHSKFKSNVLVCICAAISAGSCRDGNSVCFFHEFLDAYLKAVKPRFFMISSKPSRLKLGL